eukprot:1161696-Pelagomonas_calceolata.AAC.24
MYTRVSCIAADPLALALPAVHLSSQPRGVCGHDAFLQRGLKTQDSCHDLYQCKSRRYYEVKHCVLLVWKNDIIGPGLTSTLFVGIDHTNS